jgi:hypothetical protein
MQNSFARTSITQCPCPKQKIRMPITSCHLSTAYSKDLLAGILAGNSIEEKISDCEVIFFQNMWWIYI